MLSRALPKDEHFALALHILKEAHPELVPEKVKYLRISNFNSMSIHKLMNFILKSLKNYYRNGSHSSQILHW